MNGYECLKEEMRNRGCTPSQINSKVVPIILDILANSGNKYTEMAKKEDEFKHEEWKHEWKIESLKREISKLESISSHLRKQMEEAMEHREHCEDYIDEFNEKLSECETPEGRDVMRAVQMYVNTVNVDTKYDNTAYIIGLAAILSKGRINAINELRKINKKLPSEEIVETESGWFTTSDSRIGRKARKAKNDWKGAKSGWKGLDSVAKYEDPDNELNEIGNDLDSEDPDDDLL